MAVQAGQEAKVRRALIARLHEIHGQSLPLMLGCTEYHVKMWLEGTISVPDDAFLRAVELLITASYEKKG